MISGSRTATTADYEQIKNVLDALGPATILHGGAIGADQLAQRYANEKQIPVQVIKPDYLKYKKLAPIMRNQELVNAADAVVCFYACAYPERTNGTQHAAKYAAKNGKLKGEYWLKPHEQTSLF